MIKMTNKSDKLTAGLWGLGSGAILASGLIHILNYYSNIKDVANAVYVHADKITPEIIEQAHKLVADVCYTNYFNEGLIATLFLGGAGFCAGMSRAYSSKKE